MAIFSVMDLDVQSGGRYIRIQYELNIHLSMVHKWYASETMFRVI